MSNRSTRTPDIHLHIERLVLHDVAAVDRDRVGAAVTGELTRLLTEQGLGGALEGGAAIDRLDGGSFRSPAAARPAAVGVQIARAVHRSLKR